MKKDLFVNIGVVAVIFVVFCIIAGFIGKFNDDSVNTIKYNGNKYVLLEYNEDIFTYNYNGTDYFDVDEIYELKHDKWNVIYQEGDLLFLDKDIKAATKYYTDDDNYDWFIVFDSGETELKKNISINEEELENLYNLDKVKFEKTIAFEDIELFADVLKISKDEFVQGITTLALVDGNWYYKTEVMADDTREYVIPISESLNKKINDLLKK